jgi:hypothetical protein
MATTFKIEGIGEVIRAMSRVGAKGPTAARRGLRKWAEGVATLSKDEYCPVAQDGGQLRSTIKVEQDEDSVSISAGDESTAYAHEVHEDFTWHKTNWNFPDSINWTKAGTGPKYLERPIVQELPKAVPAMLAEIDKVERGA